MAKHCSNYALVVIFIFLIIVSVFVRQDHPRYNYFQFQSYSKFAEYGQGSRDTKPKNGLPTLKQVLGSSGIKYSGTIIRKFQTKNIQFRGNFIQNNNLTSMIESDLLCTHWAVVTTVFTPSEAVRRFLYRSKDFNWCVVVVGDKDKPLQYTIPSSVKRKVIFLSIQDQLDMRSEFVQALPFQSFGRKNVGYLYAIAQGAELIWDFDDDNMLKFWINGAAVYSNMWIGTFTKLNSSEKLDVTQVQNSKTNHLFFNPYPCLGAPNNKVWPRGFPLSEVSNKNKYNLSNTSKDWISIVENGTSLWNFRKRKIMYKDIGILQSLADHQPDVDAVYRMIEQTPFSFHKDNSLIGETLVLSDGTYSPMNAQATLHFKCAFFALYLPVTVGGRVSDIWRSYIGQTLLSIFGIHIGFLPRPLVDQDRNPHSYEDDFNSELQLYVQTKSLVQHLDRWRKQIIAQHEHKKRSLEDLVEELYIDIYERGFIEIDDVTNIQLWLKALGAANYRFGNEYGKPFVNHTHSAVLNVSVGRSALTKPHGMPRKCANLKSSKKSITFWTSDLHDGTRLDTPSVLAYLGQTVYLAGHKGSKLPYTELLKNPRIKVYSRLSSIIQNYINFYDTLDGDMIAKNLLFYQDDSVFQKVDAFICSFPSSMCELWMPFNQTKSIIFLPAHRYNLGRCTNSSWTTLTRELIKLDNMRYNTNTRKVPHVIGAMDRYDYEYLKYYTGIKSARILSSFSGFYTQGVEYKPTNKELLVFGHIPKFMNSIHSFEWTTTYKKYKHYELNNLTSHPAIIYFTYSVMSYKFTEFYSLSVPMFVPSMTYFRLDGGFGKDRTNIFRPKCSTDPDLANMPKHVSSYHSFNPNVEFKTHPEDEMYWLQYSDFYYWPHVQYFDNQTDLEAKVNAVNLGHIHTNMKEENEIRKFVLLSEWCDLILNTQT